MIRFGQREARLYRAVLFFGLVLVLFCVSKMVSAQTRHAVFVGSNKAPPGLNPLQYTHNDAEKMREVFVELGGVKSQNAEILRNPSADELLKALYKLRSRADSDNLSELFFYYSGHSDKTDLLLGNERVPFKLIREFLRDEQAKVRVAIVDSCRSGALCEVKGGKMRPGMDVGSIKPLLSTP